LGMHRGWTLDALGDMARVLRAPGMVNHKYPQRVEVLHEGHTRYTAAAFDWLLDLPQATRTSSTGRTLTGQPDLAAVASHYGVTLAQKSQTELAGSHPQHGSTHGDNFNINVAKGLWHCWRHGTGGDALTLIAVCEGLVSCDALLASGLRGEVFRQTIALANATFGPSLIRTTKQTTSLRTIHMREMPSCL